MYVTRPLSLYKTNPDALSSPPPEGPNSGYLVLQDDASSSTHFLGLIKDSEIKDLPFPQNKHHVLTHGSGYDSTRYSICFIPAINRPLSSKIYYVIKTKGRHKGKAYASSKDEEMIRCCRCNFVDDVEPRGLDPADIYQQFKVSKYLSWRNSGFSARSIALDGHPPSFLGREGWDLKSKTPNNFSLGEAAGLDPGLRARLPDFNFPISYQASSSEVVGKWYCPFMFIKDLTEKEQVKKSMFYEMTLQQHWERIFTSENKNAGSSNSSQDNNMVFVDIDVPTEFVMVLDTNVMQVHQENDVNTVVWFSSKDGRTSVGLSSLIVERMMWEEERAGWIRKKEKQEKVMKREEFGGTGRWTSYGCYMLVERFVLKRMDGTVVLNYSFNHTHVTRSKWE